MIPAQEVQGFLDVTDRTGSWAPSLCVVMGCVLLVTLITILFVTAMLLGMAQLHVYPRWTLSRQAAAH